MASMPDSETTNRGSMWELDHNLDEPMDEEAGQLKDMYREKKFSSMLLLRLAFQSLGVVFGDLGTSPLYVFYNIFPHGFDDEEEVIGALSLIIYTITLIPLMKYVFVVLRANDNGQGESVMHLIIYIHANILILGSLSELFIFLDLADVVVIIAVVILIGLFCMQHYGTDKVGWLFAPIVLIWFILIGSVGALNIHKYNSSVLKAYNPVYIFRYLRQGKSERWISLGGIMLSITGTEALYADLCHFPVLAVQIAFTLVVFPCLLLAYTGQAAYITCHKDHVVDAFYRSIPGQQNQLHLMSTAVVIVMLVTTFLMVPVMLLVWKSHWILVVIFIVLSLMVELPYFYACINKVDEGGWVPLVIAITFFVIMYIWHFCTVKRYEFEMHSKVSMAWILGLGPSLGLVRVPGIGFVYTELASGVPLIFSHFITNLPAIHSVVVFVCVKYLPVYTVPVEERFVMKRIGPKNYHMFRCIARYGYKDILKKDEDFEKMLLDRLFIYVRLESMMDGYSDSEDFTMMEQKGERSTRALLLTEKAGSNTMCSTGDLSYSSQDSIVPAKSTGNSLTRYSSQTFGDELEFLNRCKDAGVVHILGNTVVQARRDSGITKKIAVDYVYAFLRKLCRENSVIFNVPHESLLNVGQIYYI
ncbi:hypothetical protein EJB05_09720 [Eragrostis curvula]|uniref:Potassium transporter n=1 Tax=Eragrostis curvula TaxID=38414 RepID=A0A5J9W5N2_9POAL|nr:hypothetical protein EJB05_09720 [Eragrostis curvula]